MREAVIVAACRTASGRAKKGTLRHTRPDDMTAWVLEEVINRADGIKKEDVDDIIIGCAMPEGEQGMNVARIASFRAGFPVAVPAMTVNRFCTSGLQTIALAAQNIICGLNDTIIAGGVESMTMVPMGGNKPCINPYLINNWPETYMAMGTTAEVVAKKYGITREMQDEFAYNSHMKATKAIEQGKFKGEILPIDVRFYDDQKKAWQETTFDTDECVRPDTTKEGLARLRPVFDPKGTVTAGTASPMNDGAAAVLVMERKLAEKRGLKPLVKFRNFQVGGVAPEEMGIGPTVAIPKLLEKEGLKLGDIGVIELNEAFAAQSLACLKLLEMDGKNVNVNGGAIALGHPLGGTGTKLSVSIINEMLREDHQYGMVSMCIGGGMGAAGLFEKV